MVPYHGINHDQYNIASDVLKQNIGRNPVLSENLQSLVPLVAKEIVKIEVQADRHEFIRDVYNEYDMGYGENVRVAFENAVLAHSMNIKPDYKSEPTLEYIHEAVNPVNESNAKMGWKKGTKSSRDDHKAIQSLNKASDVTVAIDRKISGKASPKTKNIRRKASSGNKQYKAAMRAGVSWLKEEEAVNEMLPLVENLSDLDFDALLLIISEEEKQSIFNLMEADMNNTIEVILEDLDSLSDEDVDNLDITEDDLESIDDLYEILDDARDTEEELSEGIFSDAKAAASSAKKNKRQDLNLSAALRANNKHAKRMNLIDRGVDKLRNMAYRASAAYGRGSYAAGKAGRSIRSAASGAKAYGSAVKTGVKNAVTNAARRAKDSVVNKFNQMKSGAASKAKSVWSGIKRFGSKIASKAKYAVGKGVNALRSAGDYAKRVDDSTRKANSGSNTPMAKAKTNKTLNVKIPSRGKLGKPTNRYAPKPPASKSKTKRATPINKPEE